MVLFISILLLKEEIPILRKYYNWLDRTSIKKKMIPTQVIILIISILASMISVGSINSVNNLSKQVFTENVRNTERLNTIIKTMYRCRVTGRDILLEENLEKQEILFDNYLASFDTLDRKMDDFVKILEGERQTVFYNIIEQKNEYRDSMILSAELKMNGASEEDALYALTVVTPIANEFFRSIEQFLTDEERIMEEVLHNNDSIVKVVFYILLITNAVIAVLIFSLIKILIKNMSKNLLKLEKHVNEIANTMNMNAEIPKELFTEDEIGSIAIAVDKMKNMLFELSFKDILVDGYNFSAYQKELEYFFQNCGEEGVEVACVVADLNNLKHINDTYGHHEGDVAIKSLYQMLDQACHQYGKSFRTGGDEFIALLKGFTKEDLDECILRLEKAMIERNKETEYEFSFAFSCEVFTCSSKEEFEDFIKVVDQKMYMRKRNMKNNDVVC